MSARGSTLYVVADNVADGYAVGTSVDEGQTWQALMSYDQLAAIQTCVKQACQADCLMRASAGQWSEDFCAVTAPATPDGGMPSDGGGGMDAAPHTDAGPTGTGGSGGGSDASVTPPPKSGCSCATAPVRSLPALSVLAAIAVVAGLRRRPRARPPQKSMRRFGINRK
jgi:hypothetical protein